MKRLGCSCGGLMKSRCPEERHEDSEDSEDGIEDMIRHVDRKKAQVPT